MAVEYKVLKIDEIPRVSDTMGLVHVYRHTIKTKGGVVIRVDISEENFTPEKAAPILLGAAQNADKIKAL